MRQGQAPGAGMVSASCTREISLFIGGCQRSGTTILYEALQRHSALRSSGFDEKELWFFLELYGRPEHAPYRAHAIDRLYLKEAVKFTDQFVRKYCGSPSGHYMTAHPNSILLVPMLTKELAHAKFVLLVRDPLETLTSMINAPFAVEAGWRANRDEVSDAEIGALVEIWRSRARIVIEALDGRFGASTIVVRHENLVRDPVGELGQVLDFLGLAGEAGPGEYLASTIINSSFAPSLARFPVRDLRQTFVQNRKAMWAAPWAREVYRRSQPESVVLGYRPTPGNDDATPVVMRSTVESPCGLSGKIASIELLRAEGEQRVSACRAGEPLLLRVLIASSTDLSNGSVSFRVRRSNGDAIFGTTTFDERHKLPTITEAGMIVEFRFSALVAPGDYQIDVAFNCVTQLDYSDSILLDQIDGGLQMRILGAADRPIHYSCFLPVVCTHRRMLNDGVRNSDQGIGRPSVYPASGV